jgi:hypothetical protein
MGWLRPSSALCAGRFQSAPNVDDPVLPLAARGDSEDVIAKGICAALRLQVVDRPLTRAPRAAVLLVATDQPLERR